MDVLRNDFNAEDDLEDLSLIFNPATRFADEFELITNTIGVRHE